MEEKKSHFLKLYIRPKEPVFMPKGKKNSIFDIPPEYYTDHFKAAAAVIANKFSEEAGEKIPIVPITIPPLDEILELHRDENFSPIVPKHGRIAAKLITLFIGMRNVDDLLSLSVYTRDRVNPYLFNYCLSVSLLHRPDTRDLDLPSFIHSFPDKFIDNKIFSIAREDSYIVPEGLRVPIEIPRDWTASDLDIEHRLAYFREDLAINLHHWHWHLVYPQSGPPEVVDKNRRGELFYFMHRQIMARYNFERLCNYLQRTERLIDFDAPIKEAYFSKLDSTVASRTYPFRVEDQKLQNLRREYDQIIIDINDMKRWRDRIYEAIHTGAIIGPTGERIVLTEFEGIDILGNLVESSSISLNRDYYGNLHNSGHMVIGFIHDPEDKYLEPSGVMGDLSTAMRDPLFYRWHAFIDDIFQEFKGSLPRYTAEQLNFPGIVIKSIAVESGNRKNVFQTFLQQSDVDLSNGMNFQPSGSIFVRFTHLNHLEFVYKISVDNQSDGNRQGTCRIFLAPKFDERGNPWLFREQKDMFIELDRFAVPLKPGLSTISRESTLSSVTIPFERSFRNLDEKPAGGEALQTYNFCGCGWPQHMLLPKGRPQGMACQLFVMISNFEEDRVDQDVTGICNDADVFCGLKDKLYPDRRSMGYPFDRQPRNGVTNLQQFLTPNMRVQDVELRFFEKTFKPKEAFQEPTKPL